MEKVDAERFKQQFFSFHPKLYRIAMAMVGNKNDAEDILQDAYCKLWNKRMELQDIRNPEAFSVTLIKNMCLDFLRSPRANRHEKELETVNISCESSPDNDLERAEEVRIVKQLIEKLPEKQKLVIKLCGLENCSQEEIEEITNLSGINIRTLLFRARKTIKEQYLKMISI